MIDKLKGVLIALAALAVLAVGGVAVAGAVDNGSGGESAAEESDGGEAPDDDAGEADEQVAGTAADRAGDAALEAAGGGTVTEVERADEGDTGYEVEVERPDGSFAEVAVDEGFNAGSVEEDDD